MIKIAFFFYFTLALTSCFKKAEVLPETKPIASAALRDNKQLAEPKKPERVQLLNKEQREAIYFAASLEKEALRVMTKNQYSDDMSLFSVLSFAVEIAAGIKKSSPTRLDCTRFRFAEDAKNKKLIHVFKTCEKPERLAVDIQVGADPNHMTVTFLIKEWGSVVGLSVASVTGTDVVCDLHIKEKKLNAVECLHWTKNLLSSAVSSEDLKLKTFIFNRDQDSQFTVKGGIYKDLIEIKKIEMRVPLQGKIKLIEKEIEVIDEFAEKPVDKNAPKTADKPNEKAPGQQLPGIKIGPVDPNQQQNPNQRNEVQQLGDLIEKNSKQNQGNYGEEGNGQEQNQGQSQGQEQNGNPEKGTGFANQVGPQDNQQNSQQQNQEGIDQQNQQPQQNGSQGQQPQQNGSQGQQPQKRQPYKPENGTEQPIPQGRQDETNGGIPPQGR